MSPRHVVIAFTAVAMLIIFGLLRLTHITDWSWWAVTVSVWGSWLAYLAFGLCIVAIAIAARLGWIR
jgi:hypothetical protein